MNRYLLLCLLSLFLTSCSSEPVVESSKLGRFGDAPLFEFQDSSNTTFSSSSLRGAPWVLFFFFTSCDGPCPLVTANVKEVDESLGADSEVQFVGISVDPEADSPEVLREYAAKLGVDSNWTFLTGEFEEVRKLATDGFKVGSSDEKTGHSTRLILVDANQVVRGFYRGLDEQEVNILKKDILRLQPE